MPNSRRFHVPNLPQHVVQRGNNRQPCFITDDDRSEYLIRLAVASRKYAVAIHAYALMPNHVHLFATPEAGNGVAKMMQAVGSGYVRTFNARHHRSGTLWDGRYFSSLVGLDAYFWNCHRYIELNPVRAGLVARPADYRWTSFARNALGRPDQVVTPHQAYLALARCISEVPAAYSSLFARPLAESTLEEIRHRLQQERVYGDEALVSRIELQSPRSPRSRRAGRPAAEEITISDLFSSKG